MQTKAEAEASQKGKAIKNWFTYKALTIRWTILGDTSIQAITM